MNSDKKNQVNPQDVPKSNGPRPPFSLPNENGAPPASNPHILIPIPNGAKPQQPEPNPDPAKRVDVPTPARKTPAPRAEAPRTIAPQKQKRRMHPILKFFVIVFSIVIAFVVIAGAAVVGYLNTDGSQPIASRLPFIAPPTSTQVDPTATDGPKQQDSKGGLFSTLLLPPEKTNVLIIGLDESETLADVMIVASFDRDTQNISLVTIPRDTYTVLGESDIQALEEAGRWAPNVLKMNEVHSYAGQKLGTEYVQKAIEQLLGIDINYYVEVNLKAFKNIVDAVGGVDMLIRPEGYYYDDPYQDPPLHIAIPGGLQHLDGTMAEGVVRYRHDYAQGDIGRVAVQQEFLSEMFSQILTKDNITKNWMNFLTTIVQYVKTDFNIADASRYLRYVEDLSPDKFETYTIPGESQYVNSKSYYLSDPEATAELVQEVFYSSPEPSPSPTPTPSGTPTVDYKTLKIEVLNGSAQDGKAGLVDNILSADGFNVVAIGNYAGTKMESTQIISRTGDMAETFADYFHNPIDVVDNEMSADFDIIIVVGTED